MDKLQTVDLPQGYFLRQGSVLDKPLLLKFLNRTYQELSADENFGHLSNTLNAYFSQETPVWWVETGQNRQENSPCLPSFSSSQSRRTPVACLWLGLAIDQLTGDRHAHVFLLYVSQLHRRRGIGRSLMQLAERWARERGDRQIGLQVFQDNDPALNLYRALGYETQSLWMIKSLDSSA